MNMTKPLTHEELKQRLKYDSDVGMFFYAKKVMNFNVGDRAGTVTQQGYRQVIINKKSYLEHRLVWFYVHGVWPDKYIDHIDGNKLNNKITNLRDVDDVANKENMYQAQKNNKCGLLGVSYKSKNNHYVARINKAGKSIYLGVYKTAEEASNAYQLAKKKYHISQVNY